MNKIWYPYEGDILDHPKFVVLSGDAACLWWQAKNYCDKHLTDGVIPLAAFKAFRFYSKARLSALTTPVAGYTSALLSVTDAGVVMHDYLEHNWSRKIVGERQAAAEKERQRVRAKQDAYRQRTQAPVTAVVTGNNSVAETGALPDIQNKVRTTQDPDPVLKNEPDRSARPVSAGEHTLFIDAFRDHWKAIYGHECSLIMSPLQFSDLDKQLADHPLAKLLDALDAYFVTRDAYVIRGKHPLQLFLRDPLKYLAREQHVPAAGKLATNLAAALANIKQEHGR